MLSKNKKKRCSLTIQMVLFGSQKHYTLFGLRAVFKVEYTVMVTQNIGGGCYSGKDPTKVDRSASYMARYLAKNIVAASVADRVEVQLAYAIGVAEPVSVLIDTFGTSKIDPQKIFHIVKGLFDLTPKGIIDKLDLRRPIFKKTAAYGHFGRNDPDFTWEKTDMAETIKKEAGL